MKGRVANSAACGRLGAGCVRAPALHAVRARQPMSKRPRVLIVSVLPDVMPPEDGKQIAPHDGPYLCATSTVQSERERGSCSDACSPKKAAADNKQHAGARGSDPAGSRRVVLVPERALRA